MRYVSTGLRSQHVMADSAGDLDELPFQSFRAQTSASQFFLQIR